MTINNFKNEEYVEYGKELAFIYFIELLTSTTGSFWKSAVPRNDIL